MSLTLSQVDTGPDMTLVLSGCKSPCMSVCTFYWHNLRCCYDVDLIPSSPRPPNPNQSISYSFQSGLVFMLRPSKVIRMSIHLWLYTHGDFIVLPYWKTMSSAPWLDFTLPHYLDTKLASPILLMVNARLGNKNYQICKFFIWFIQVLNPVSVLLLIQPSCPVRSNATINNRI